MTVSSEIDASGEPAWAFFWERQDDSVGDRRGERDILTGPARGKVTITT